MQKKFLVSFLFNKRTLLSGLFFGLIIMGIFLIWITTITLPNLNNFEERRVAQSTKIYDRTGKVVLYDVFGEYKRTVVSLDKISPNLINATIAVEDKDFYSHNGVQFSAIFRAVFVNIRSGKLLGGQGGSTITQQVIKNALLNREKTLSRKIKEWVLAPRLEKILTKDQILEVYLNEIPYGGNVYGAEEASRRFFGKSAMDLSLAEAAYLAALPNAPTYFSPYGNHADKLEQRKNFILDQMVITGAISKEEAERAKSEKVIFLKQENFGISAPHFVMYVIDLLEKEYGKEAVQEGGLKVTTTLDWELQQRAEEIVKKRAFENKTNFNAENGAIVATDPRNGEILVMVGSRDYFDKEIDGNFNVTTSMRQPGSAFKPIAYAEAFNKGYRPETVVFDVQTEFSTACASGGSCYSPQNYDNIFRGPINLRNALAQSVNVPAVKVLYLAGIRDVLNLAKKMGLETLTNVDQYGLTLVLGGGEVRPLDMASAYGIFANEGIKYPQTAILKIEDNKGKTIFEDKEEERTKEQVLPSQTARLISDVLTDNDARSPAFGSNSYLNFPNDDVAVKTGTTNDYRDAWIVGYTPNISVAAWAGNNDNSPMEKKVAGFIVAPMWNEFMNFAINKREKSLFNMPDPIDPNIKPILAGYWKGENTQVIDKKTGEPATKETPQEDREVIIRGGEGIHSILYWVNRADPLGPRPNNPSYDSQFNLWEKAVREWVSRQNISENITPGTTSFSKDPTRMLVLSPKNNSEFTMSENIEVKISLSGGAGIEGSEVYIDNTKITPLNPQTKSVTLSPMETGLTPGNHKIKITVRTNRNETLTEEISVEIK